MKQSGLIKRMEIAQARRDEEVRHHARVFMLDLVTIALGEREQLRSSGVVVSREEITAFFRSKWAAMLAAGAGLESYTIEGFQC